jgi:DNA polymerase-1
LDVLASKYFDYKMISYDEITDKAKINFREVPLDIAANYSAEDVYVTAKLYENQEKVRDESILKDIELPLIEVLKDMEISGVRIDEEKLREI